MDELIGKFAMSRPLLDFGIQILYRFAMLCDLLRPCLVDCYDTLRSCKIDIDLTPCTIYRMAEGKVFAKLGVVLVVSMLALVERYLRRSDPSFNVCLTEACVSLTEACISLKHERAGAKTDARMFPELTVGRVVVGVGATVLLPLPRLMVVVVSPLPRLLSW